MKCRAPSRHLTIDHEDAILKSETNIALQPGPQDRPFPGIPAFCQQDSNLQFLQGDYRDIQGGRIHAIGPSANLSVSFPTPNFPKFGNDIRIEQIHQAKFAARASSLETGTSSSMSSAPGIASKSAMLRVFPKTFR